MREKCGRKFLCGNLREVGVSLTLNAWELATMYIEVVKPLTENT